MTKTYKRKAILTGHVGNSLEQIAETIPILPEGIKFCNYAGTKYECCKNKVCFENSYCGVRDFRNKYNL